MKRYIIPFVSLALSGLLFADNHSQSLFNGKDLTGWQDRNGNASKWEVVDGNLQGKKKLGDIWSKERYPGGEFDVSKSEHRAEGDL